jgi:protein disulfide-isomerase A6
MLLQIFALTLALAPSLASAAIFPKDTHVKMLDAKSFKKAMKKNVSHINVCHWLVLNAKVLGNKRCRVCRAMVWCTSPDILRYQDIAEHTCALQHCQRMAPEYSKAALSLHPLIPFYAVDCDAESNKRLCGGQVSTLSC